jgi:transcriptional regulator with XRE-family HTH domain
MAVEVDVGNVRALMAARQLDLTALAKRAGLSRQAVHRFLRPGHCPLSRGFVAVAEALGTSPVALLRSSGGRPLPWDEPLDLVRAAATGEARAFELLPAEVRKAAGRGYCPDETLAPVHHQLIAAAAEVALELAPSDRLRRIAARHAAAVEPGRAFFFAADLMSPDRIVVATPAPMARHLVFGAFAMDDFARHLR